MTLKFYRCLLYLLSITDDMDINSNGKSNACYVRIRKGYKDDKGL
jgi:hypothetical protein